MFQMAARYGNKTLDNNKIQVNSDQIKKWTEFIEMSPIGTNKTSGGKEDLNSFRLMSIIAMTC